MKKSLIALAVIGAFAAQSAMAADGTTIYGAANVSFDAVSNGNTGTSSSANSLSSNASHIGFKGNENLGDGLSAIWQIEENVNFASSGSGTSANGTATPFASASTFTARDTFLGLSSTSMGTVIAGIHDTPYKMATRGMDVFADTIGDNRSIMGNSGKAAFGNVALGDVRLNNVVAYISPVMSGFTLAAATITGAEIGSASGTTKGDAWSLAALYGAGPINASFAYQEITIGSSGTGTLSAANFGLAANDKVSMWKAGGGYDFGQGLVNLVYEKNTSSGIAAIDPLDRASWMLSGKYNVSASDAVKAAYTHAGNVGSSATDTSAKQFTLGYDHNLSKHTTVYALYSKLSNGAAAAYTLGNPDANSNNATTATSTAGSSPSVFSLGMKHAF
jgi:predicted porin